MPGCNPLRCPSLVDSSKGLNAPNQMRHQHRHDLQIPNGNASKTRTSPPLQHLILGPLGNWPVRGLQSVDGMWMVSTKAVVPGHFILAFCGHLSTTTVNDPCVINPLWGSQNGTYSATETEVIIRRRRNALAGKPCPSAMSFVSPPPPVQRFHGQQGAVSTATSLRRSDRCRTSPECPVR